MNPVKEAFGGNDLGVELVIEYQEGNQFAFDHLLELYAPIIRYKSKKYYAPGLQCDDLWQEGCIGLFEAVNRYKKDGGSLFRPFAKTHIQNHIINAIKKATRKKHELCNKAISLYEPYRAEEGYHLIDQIPSNNPTPEDIIMRGDGDETSFLQSQNILLLFSDIEKKVLQYYLDGFSYHEVAGVVGINYKSVDNALKRVKMKLRKIQDEIVC